MHFQRDVAGTSTSGSSVGPIALHEWISPWLPVAADPKTPFGMNRVHTCQQSK